LDAGYRSSFLHGPETGEAGRAALNAACQSYEIDKRQVRLLLAEEVIDD